MKRTPHQTDLARAHKFAVQWATKDSSGEIANLARAFLRVSADLESTKAPMRVGSVWDHKDGSPHSATGPLGCFGCANERRQAAK
jgi:hypothetical protein